MDLRFFIEAKHDNSAPSYSFRKRRRARPVYGFAKLHWDDVRAIRKWTTREGFGMDLSDQIRCVQKHYPVNEATLRELIKNLSWYDPAYTPFSFDATWLPPVAWPLYMLIRSYAYSR